MPLLFMALLAVGAWWFIHSSAAPDLHPGNPNNRPVTDTERAVIANDNQTRRELADEVAHGDKSFEEAGCEYRAGEWDIQREACENPARSVTKRP
jgi:hypothetical protein